MKIFNPSNILIPKTPMDKWATIACDQHTSDPSYWEKADAFVGTVPSALRVILPEVYLAADNDEAIKRINATMQQYLDEGLFTEHENAMIYIERRQANGKVRRGIVGAIDLEAYDFQKGASTPIRATEATVPERIPPRVEIRKNAPIELPHAMLLIDDVKRSVIEGLAEKTDAMTLLYDCELMLGGGSIKGYLLTEDLIAKILAALDTLAEENPLLFAVGDGNHSLATAKTCYELDPNEKNRYALCEIVNIHDGALEFEPIYRVLFGTTKEAVLSAISNYTAKHSSVSATQSVTLISGGGEIDLTLPAVYSLPVSTLQDLIDRFLKDNPSVTVDYIHGIDETRELSAKDNAVGFLFEGMAKSQLFPTVIRDGSLVRKTFSMGEACDKRYYVEARKIK